MAATQLDTSHDAMRLLTCDIISHIDLITICPLDFHWKNNGRFLTDTAYMSGVRPGLGKLEVLPVEVQRLVLKEMDPKTLLDLRRVNKRAMEAVNELLIWKKIVAHVPNTLRMIAGYTWDACPYTLTQLFEKLFQIKCDFCDEAAPYLDMATLHRRCFNNRSCPGESARARGCCESYIKDTSSPYGGFIRRGDYDRCLDRLMGEFRTSRLDDPGVSTLDRADPGLFHPLYVPWLQENGDAVEYPQFCGVCTDAARVTRNALHGKHTQDAFAMWVFNSSGEQS